MDSDGNSSMEIDGGKHAQHEKVADTILTPPPTAQHRTIESSDTDTDSETEDQRPWRCQPIESVHRGMQPFVLDHLGPVMPSVQHKVLHRHPIREPPSKAPRPHRAAHKWDAKHVRLPCAPESKYPVETEDGTSEIESRWSMIERALLRPIGNSRELQAAILSYNTTYRSQWGFKTLHKLFDQELDESESRVFFEDLLPRITRLALRLPELIQAPIPLLCQNQSSALTLTQEQISCLLANALLCTFPRRNTLKRRSEYSSFPDINFNRLYQTNNSVIYEKLKCIFHYFRRVCPTERDDSNVPTGCVTFMRLSDKPKTQVDWTQSGASLSSIPVHINASGTIESGGVGLLQVDFANMYLGGGVLGHGCVQEEIRFLICPELIVSKLFTECLAPNEALLMVGCERYCKYSGYASSFTWEGNYEDRTPYDSSRRRRTALVAIDALSFYQGLSDEQYRENLMLRELNKASIGFRPLLSKPPPGVATGNWGCGAFGGDPYLKALLQIMVCAHHGRPLAYFTFGNAELRDDLYELWQLFREHGTTVQQLWSILRRFKQDANQRELFQFVLEEVKKLHSKLVLDKTKETAVGVGAGTAVGGATVAGAAAAVTTSHSPDLFADDSMNDSLANGVLISDDEDNADDEQEQANAMMSAASLESCGSSSSNSNSNGAAGKAGAAGVVKTGGASGAASGAAVGATTANTRQLTLLEMLDRHYDQGNPNGSKRQHQSSISEKCLKTRKDC